MGEFRIAVVFSIQTWLGESEDSQKSGGTPGYFSVGMSGMFLFFFSLLSICLTEISAEDAEIDNTFC